MKRLGGIVGGVYVCLAGCREKPPATTGAPGSAGPAATFTTTAATAERSGGHLHLTVSLKVHNAGAGPLSPVPPAVQLWIGKDKPAVPFIAPGLEPPLVASGAEAAVDTHWWLSAADFAESLDLEVTGDRHPVKSGGSITFDALPENQTVPLTLP